MTPPSARIRTSSPPEYTAALHGFGFRVIVWLAVAALLHASFAVQVRVTIFSNGAVPGATASANVTVVSESHVSDAVALPVAVGCCAPHAVVAVAGGETVGAVLSATTIVWVIAVAPPQESVAVNVRAMYDAPLHPPAHDTSAAAS